MEVDSPNPVLSQPSKIRPINKNNMKQIIESTYIIDVIILVESMFPCQVH